MRQKVGDARSCNFLRNSHKFLTFMGENFNFASNFSKTAPNFALWDNFRTIRFSDEQKIW